MVASVFELFKIGVGPSSSHTMGPMTAAADFAASAAALAPVRVEVQLFGSLALTGKGHATDRAILLGLAGERPEALCPDHAAMLVDCIRRNQHLDLGGHHRIGFAESADLVWHQRRRLPHHSNGMMFTAFAGDGTPLASCTTYSIGGGAVIGEADIARNAPPTVLGDLPYPFHSGANLLSLCQSAGRDIAGLAFVNELTVSGETEIRARLAAIRAAMSDCIDRGCATPGELPGGLKVQRRAPAILALLRGRAERALADPLSVLDWVNLWALAVNEENAAGGRVVTAPTNGAAGIIPAVLRYYERFAPGADDRWRRSLPAHRRCHRQPVQGKCQHLGRRSRLPGRSRRRLLDGSGRADRRARRHADAGRKCRRDRHGA